MSKILVVGACGQIGIELVIELRKRYGIKNVIASDIKEKCPPAIDEGLYFQLDIMDLIQLEEIVMQNDIQQVYLLAALLSATAEKKPRFAWELNMQGLFNVLELAKNKKIAKIFLKIPNISIDLGKLDTERKQLSLFKIFITI